MLLYSLDKRYGRRFSTVLIFFITLWTFINIAEAREASVTTKKHFLWSVQSERNTIYMLGSIHILRKDSYPLPEAVERVYDCCQKVVFETDLEGMNAPDVQMKMMKMGLYSSGQTLSQNISRQTYELLKEKMDKTGLPIVQFEQVKPWLIAQTIASSELIRLGFDPSLGIDTYFFNKARNDKKETLSLETNDYQISLFAGLSKRQQEILLRQTLKELEVIEGNFTDMIDSWENGNVSKLASIMEKSFEGYPDLYRRFVTERNKNWIKNIQRMMMKGDNVLIIVGAAHLAGKDSVIELLKEKGYKVTQQ
jgi:hypothetical protein